MREEKWRSGFFTLLLGEGEGEGEKNSVTTYHLLVITTLTTTYHIYTLIELWITKVLAANCSLPLPLPDKIGNSLYYTQSRKTKRCAIYE